MAHTNTQILSAVLARWMQPMAHQLAGDKLRSLPFLTALENKIKSTGWVSPNYNLMNEFSPLVGGVSDKLLTPIIYNMVKDLPNESLPEMAHEIVDNAISQGSLSLFEGKVTFEQCDLEQLKKLLDFNLPVQNNETYTVRCE